MMRLELLNTGSELLLGAVLNTHVRYIADQLFPLGLRLERQTTVPDGAAIGSAMRESFGRCDILIVTGGLGPTSDDITRDLAAELLGVSMQQDPEVLQAIDARMSRRGFVMNAAIARQALVPDGAQVLPNTNGTAPGLYFPPRPLDGGGHSPHLFLLPGPPRELYPMFEREVEPRLDALTETTTTTHATYKIVGLGESKVQDLLEHQLLKLGSVEIGYCARPGEVDLRLIAEPALIEQATPMIAHACGDALISDDGRSLGEVLLGELRERNQTLVTAESCTGGRIANAMTDLPGASEVFLGGVVAYANEVKIGQLNVSPELLKAKGAVSAEVAEQMAEGVRLALHADLAISTTGIAGPGGGTELKPAGTVFIGISQKGKNAFAVRKDFPSDRDTFKHLTMQTAFLLALRQLRDE